MVRRNSEVTIFQRSAQGSEVWGKNGKEFWRSLVLVALSCFVQWSLFFGVVAVVCAIGVEVKVKVTERNKTRVRG
jgi:hypothetical protein